MPHASSRHEGQGMSRHPDSLALGWVKRAWCYSKGQIFPWCHFLPVQNGWGDGSLRHPRHPPRPQGKTEALFLHFFQWQEMIFCGVLDKEVPPFPKDSEELPPCRALQGLALKKTRKAETECSKLCPCHANFCHHLYKCLNDCGCLAGLGFHLLGCVFTCCTTL